MDFHEGLNFLQENKEFKKWQEANPDSFLAHAFVMIDEQNKDVLQFGYYNEKNEKMTTFIIDKKEVKQLPEQEVLKSGQTIARLDNSEVKISEQDAVEIADRTKKENYPQEITAKSFYIIQHLESGPVYNITYFTQSFKTINIKISTVDGRVVKHSMQALAGFSKE